MSNEFSKSLLFKTNKRLIAFLIALTVLKIIFSSIFTLVYLTSSYRLVDIFIRSAVGEYTAFIFFPIIAVGVWKMYLAEEMLQV